MAKNIGVCALCNKTRTLKESHIVPKFIGKWLKNTSLTGHIRNVQEANKRAQDITKEYLLCGDCEQKFSNYERPFAENIFKPHHRGIKELPYDEGLLNLIISIQWRVIVNRKSTLRGLSDELLSHLDNAQEIFRQYLNDESDNYGDYSHHLFFVDTDTDMDTNFNNPNMYFQRSIDATIASNGHSTLFVYTKLPGIIINSNIKPMDGWVNTEIKKEKGSIVFPQVIEVSGYSEFIESRINESRNYNISSLQVEKINKDIQINIDKLDKSKSYKAALADINLKYHINNDEKV